MKKVKRTFGWVQNPGNLRTLKKVISIFVKESEIFNWLIQERLPLLQDLNLIDNDVYSDVKRNITAIGLNDRSYTYPYSLLKGKGAIGARSDALCTGLIQAVIDAQKIKTYTFKNGSTITIKKPYTDDWTAEGYLRWAISCGLVNYNSQQDSCSISDLGFNLVLSQDFSDEEEGYFSHALLHYPPVVRILTLLKDTPNQTKFDLGQKLGFKGELGFSSFTRELFVYDMANASSSKERSNIRSNMEGDADKYARSICSWLQQMKWVETESKEFNEHCFGTDCSATLNTYKLTREGEKALIRANGNSSNAKIERIVHYEMLASNRANDADYLRALRAKLLFKLKQKLSLNKIVDYFNREGLKVSSCEIEDHIKGLQSIGLNIIINNGTYVLKDKIIRLEIPSRTTNVCNQVLDIKNRVRDRLKHIDHEFLVLIDLAYSDAIGSKKNNDARLFEIKTAELFTKELNFLGCRLGESNRPDVIISYEENGAILDNKSYKDGFRLDKHNADEMSRYVRENKERISKIPPNEWWKNFNDDVKNFFFMFITSFASGNVNKNLDYMNKTLGVKGAIIGIEDLLYISDDIKARMLTQSDFFNLIDNDVITYCKM